MKYPAFDEGEDKNQQMLRCYNLSIRLLDRTKGKFQVMPLRNNGRPIQFSDFVDWKISRIRYGQRKMQEASLERAAYNDLTHKYLDTKKLKTNGWFWYTSE